MSIILGVDPSLNSLGFFIFDTNGMKVLDYGYIDNRKLEENQKLLIIYNELSQMFQKYKIDGIGIEKEFYSSNIDTLCRLSHTHGVVLLAAAHNNVPYVYYSVLTLKSQVLNGMKLKKEDGTKKTGDDLKKEVAIEIFRIFGRENFKKDFTNDVTDAASAAYVYYKLDGKEIEKQPKKKKKKKDKKEDS